MSATKKVAVRHYLQLRYPRQNGKTLPCERLMDQREQLRELVRDMWNWLAPTAVGGGAPLKELYDRMRDLGVDVDTERTNDDKGELE